MPSEPSAILRSSDFFAIGLSPSLNSKTKNFLENRSTFRFPFDPIDWKFSYNHTRLTCYRFG